MYSVHIDTGFIRADPPAAAGILGPGGNNVHLVPPLDHPPGNFVGPGSAVRLRCRKVLMQVENAAGAGAARAARDREGGLRSIKHATHPAPPTAATGCSCSSIRR